MSRNLSRARPSARALAGSPLIRRAAASLALGDCQIPHVARATSAQLVDGLPNLDGVADGPAQRRVHGGDHGRGADAVGFAEPSHGLGLGETAGPGRDRSWTPRQPRLYPCPLCPAVCWSRPPDVDRVQFRVVAPAEGNDVRHPGSSDSREPTELAFCQVGQFGVREDAHFALLTYRRVSWHAGLTFFDA